MKAFMRRVSVVLLLTGMATFDLISQDIEINAFSGYSFESRFSIRGGRGEIGPGHTYGVASSFHSDAGINTLAPGAL